MNRNQQMIATLIEQLRYKLLPFSRMEKLNLLRDLAVKEKDEKLIRLSCGTIIEYINMNISKLELDEQIKAHTMLKDAYTCYAPYNFEAYLIAMEWNRPVEKRFYQPRMKVLKPVINDLQDLGDGVIDVYCLSMPPRIGKLVADNTPVLTTEGWKKHGELKIGDYVFSPNGKAVRVTHVHPKNVADIKIEFSNGEVIKCHENHEWVLYDRCVRKYRLIETKELLRRKIETGVPNKRGHRYIFQLPLRNPIKGVKNDLKVDPYVLGAWLGDGENQNPVLCYPKIDEIVMETFIEKGYIISSSHVHGGTGVRYAYFTKLREQLQEYGMCYSKRKADKYIPDDYLHADIYDRLELLAGLLDTDGTLSKKERRYRFSTTSERLKDTFIQLISTFGWRCSVTKHEPMISSSGIHGRLPVYDIGFNPTFHIPCRVERKQLFEFSKQNKISITSVERCEPEQGNCITVEEGVYCVGHTMIPTHNSTIGLFFISWMAGKYPDEHIFAAGYASGLVGTFYNGVMDFIDSSEYRFYDIFPELLGNFNKSAENRTIDLWKDDRYKTITFRSIDGQITGALEASSLLYLDDMCSGIEEAMNIDRLDKLWSKVSVDLMQRRVRNPRSGRSAPILAIGTIWSIHDPICRLKERYKDDPRFRERVMPALSVELKSNFDYDYGVGFTTEMYLELKAGMDEVSWECVYQQNPMERDGLLFPNSELKRFTQVPNSPPDMVIAFCDVAFGGDDFLSFPIAAYWGDDGYVIDVVFRKKARYQITEPMVAGKIVSNGVQNAEFESNNGGEFYAKDVDDMVKNGSTHRCNITTSLAGNKKSKLARIIQYQGDIKNLYFRDPSSYKPDSEYGLFMTNLTTFVQTGSSLNDDAPDSLAGLCKLKKIPRVGRVETMPGMRGAM